MMSAELLEVGTIAKAHGVRGDLIIRPLSNVPERFGKGAVLVVQEPRLQELVIERSQAYQRGWLVHIKGVDSRSEAEQLCGTILFGEPMEYDDALALHEMIGAMVIDSSGVPRGRVIAVEANPAADLLVLESAALVPFTFVVRFDADSAEVIVDVPEGLFELFEEGDTA
jgi:16S rRNA processing protein RimM